MAFDRPLVQTLPMRYLMILPVILAVSTVGLLFAVSDVNVALLQSQCHSHARLPELSRIPVVGTFFCTLVSFFQISLDSWRAKAVMGVIIALAGSLITVTTVESARPCNKKARLVANPTPAWIILNLLGGAIIWQLLIVPVHLRRSRETFLEKDPQNQEEAGTDEREREEERNVPLSEVIAIPVSLLIGYYLPSALMVSLNSIATIATWQFFPVYVSFIRILVRFVVERFWPETATTMIHLESHRKSMAAVYALPTIVSILSQGTAFWSLTWPEDRKEMTRSTLPLIEMDLLSIGVATLYWVFAEVGWKIPAKMLGLSAVFGPGAGLVSGWVLRETVFREEIASSRQATQHGDGPSEETPLLQ